MNMKTSYPRILLVLGGLATGCGGGDSPGGPAPATPGPDHVGDAPASGGTRLKAVVAEATDGTRHMFHWQDTRLDVPCTFQRVGPEEASGGLRCIPSGEAVVAVQKLVFGDAGCTSPMAVVMMNPGGPACTPPRFAWKGSTGTVCEPNPSFYRLGERVASRALFEREGGECRAVETRTALHFPDVFRVDPLALSELAGASLRAGPAKEGVAPVELVAEDGARAYVGLRDAAGGFDCTVAGTTAGLRCIPVQSDGALVGPIFADARCSQPAGMGLTCPIGDRPSVRFAFEYGFADGRSLMRVYRGGARLTVGYTKVGTECQPQMTWGGAYALGEEVAPSSFVTGSLETVMRPSGLIEEVESAGGWSRPKPDTLKLPGPVGTRCVFAETSDGIMRCLPPARLSGGYFADDRCSQPLVLDYGDEATVLDRGCPRRGTVFARGQRHLGDVYQIGAAGCERTFKQTADINKFEYHTIGPELPPERFVAMPVTLR